MYSKDEAKEKKAYYLINKKKILAKRKVFRELNRKRVNEIANRSYHNRKEIVSLARKSKYWSNSEFRKEVNRHNRLVNRKWYSRNNKLVSEKRQKIKALVVHHYSNGKNECECCKVKELKFLAVDHVNNDGSKDRKKKGSGHPFYCWLIRNNFPNNPALQVLCFNCNWAKRYEGGCPHKLLV